MGGGNEGKGWLYRWYVSWYRDPKELYSMSLFGTHQKFIRKENGVLECYEYRILFLVASWMESISNFFHPLLRFSKSILLLSYSHQTNLKLSKNSCSWGDIISASYYWQTRPTLFPLLTIIKEWNCVEHCSFFFFRNRIPHLFLFCQPSLYVFQLT